VGSTDPAAGFGEMAKNSPRGAAVRPMMPPGAAANLRSAPEVSWNKFKPIPGSSSAFFCVKHRFFYSLGGYKHAYDRVFWLLYGLLWVMCYPLLVFMIVLGPKHVRLAKSALKLSLD